MSETNEDEEAQRQIHELGDSLLLLVVVLLTISPRDVLGYWHWRLCYSSSVSA